MKLLEKMTRLFSPSALLEEINQIEVEEQLPNGQINTSITERNFEERYEELATKLDNYHANTSKYIHQVIEENNEQLNETMEGKLEELTTLFFDKSIEEIENGSLDISKELEELNLMLAEMDDTFNKEETGEKVNE